MKANFISDIFSSFSFPSVLDPDPSDDATDAQTQDRSVDAPSPLETLVQPVQALWRWGVSVGSRAISEAIDATATTSLPFLADVVIDDFRMIKDLPHDVQS